MSETLSQNSGQDPESQKTPFEISLVDDDGNVIIPNSVIQNIRQCFLYHARQIHIMTGKANSVPHSHKRKKARSKGTKQTVFKDRSAQKKELRKTPVKENTGFDNTYTDVLADLDDTIGLQQNPTSLDEVMKSLEALELSTKARAYFVNANRIAAILNSRWTLSSFNFDQVEAIMERLQAGKKIGKLLKNIDDDLERRMARVRKMLKKAAAERRDQPIGLIEDPISIQEVRERLVALNKSNMDVNSVGQILSQRWTEATFDIRQIRSIIELLKTGRKIDHVVQEIDRIPEGPNVDLSSGQYNSDYFGAETDIETIVDDHNPVPPFFRG